MTFSFNYVLWTCQLNRRQLKCKLIFFVQFGYLLNVGKLKVKGKATLFSNLYRTSWNLNGRSTDEFHFQYVFVSQIKSALIPHITNAFQ